ncbi:MAG TPA: asparagine synthase (glutamine-hydrolyzing) [Longimicrobiales bacterium]
MGGVLRRSVTESDRKEFLSAVRMLEHRGPDDEGLSVAGGANAILGFRRLSIVDLAGGAQPMDTGEGEHIVFNGEIYNYAELRGGLERSGVTLRTRSDTEALLWTMTRKGRDGLSDLVGMFAFAFVDLKRRRMLLARDRLGVKQLYYADTPEGFFFASEPKALLTLPWITPELATEQLNAYFTFRSVPSPHTLFRGIRKLGAGEVLELDLDTHSWSVDRYWTMPVPRVEGGAGMSASLDRFEEAFLGSVKRRLIADVPVGAFLSGGLDSSLVVAAMKRLGHADIATFSAAFPGSPDDEGSFARRVSRAFDTHHYEHQASPDEFLGSLPTWISLNDDLVADASCLPLLAVSRLARANGYLVLLSGEGADELFGGYGSYHKFIGLNRLHRLLMADGPRNLAVRALEKSGRLGGQDRPRTEEYLVRGGAFMGTAALFGPSELSLLLNEEAYATGALPRAGGARMEDLLAFDFRSRIPEDLMVRTDRATMGASIEARVPFLDPAVVTAAFDLAPHQRSLPGISKVLLRLLANRWGVPRQTILHRKIGFQIPIGSWFKSELRPLWGRILDDRLVPGIRYERVASIYQSHVRGEGSFEEILWRVAALELWYRRWVLNSSDVLGIVGDRPAERTMAA